MTEAQRYKLIYAPEVKEHLKAIDKQHHARIRDAIKEQLSLKPDRETRNRKPVREGALWEDAWELRCGEQNRFRVFYQIDYENAEIRILAIGVKDRNQLTIGKEKINL